MDEDGTANGVIVNPVGLAQAVSSDESAPVGAPTTGIPQQSLLVMYAAIAAGIGLIGYETARVYRKKRQILN